MTTTKAAAKDDARQWRVSSPRDAVLGAFGGAVAVLPPQVRLLSATPATPPQWARWRAGAAPADVHVLDGQRALARAARALVVAAASPAAAAIGGAGAARAVILLLTTTSKALEERLSRITWFAMERRNQTSIPSSRVRGFHLR